ncbi:MULTISPECIES: Gfo/Idh/MocA family protein [unclassified Cellvibrio]|uniref:Gfo/Idh/MocA family protein n=1 Tax=unclassified Cellvibrio TaxID=2624793 RepID=UPI001CD988CE|nr:MULTISPECIES: Gfo/Idh/MocA family oxidoreductase [unclassified Cellvibrio]
MNKKVRWGIVGAGRIAHTFAKDIAHTKSAELVAVAARSLGNATSFASEYDIEKQYGNYDELYHDADVDAIYIATPHNLHVQQVLDALKAGKHVLCEKPVTVSAAECEELIACAKSMNCFFMEAMWTYFLPAVVQAKRWVEQGRIGQIRHVKSDFGYPLPYDPDRREYDAALAGGCLLEMGVYPVAMAHMFIQEDLLQHYSSVKLAPNGVETDVSTIITYPNAIATIGSSFSAKLQNWTYVIGTDGYIAIPDFWRADKCYLYKLDEQVDAFFDGRTTLGFDYQIESASCDILAGKIQSDVVPHSASLRFQRLMELIKTEWNCLG